MEYIATILNALTLILGAALLIVCGSLIRLIRKNSDQKVESVLPKIYQLTTACAILTVAEAAAVIASLFCS